MKQETNIRSKKIIPIKQAGMVILEISFGILAFSSAKLNKIRKK
jgi:hypothetical protein